MSRLSLRAGDRLIVDGIDGNIVLQFDQISGRCAQLVVNSMDDISVKRNDGQEKETGVCDVQSVLKDMTEEILAQFSELDAASSQEMISQLVSDLFLGLAQKRQREERRTRQSEGIAEAKGRGVRFGRSYKPLPENFEAYREAWRGGQVTLRQAAQACGMNHTTFRNAVLRAEGSA